MFRLLIITVAVVLATNWLLDRTPADPVRSVRAVDEAAGAALREQVLETPVTWDVPSWNLAEVLDQLATRYDLPLERADPDHDDWIYAAPDRLAIPLRLESALEYLRETSRVISWKWHGERLVVSLGADDRLNVTQWLGAEQEGRMEEPAHLASNCEWEALRVVPWRRDRLARGDPGTTQVMIGGLPALDSEDRARHSALGEILRRMTHREIAEPVELDLSPGGHRARQAIEAALDRTVEIDFQAATLADALAHLQAQLGVNIVSPRAEADTLKPPHAQLVSLKGRWPARQALQQILWDSRHSFRVRTGVILVEQPAFFLLAEEYRPYRVYPAWPYLDHAAGLDAPALAELLRESLNPHRWDFPDEDVQSPEGSLLIGTTDEGHAALDEFFRGLATWDAPPSAVVVPPFDANIEAALAQRVSLDTKPVPLGGFAQHLSQLMGVPCRIHSQFDRADPPLMAGDGQGGTIAQQLDRILLPDRLDYVERAAGLEIVAAEREEDEETRIYPVGDLLPASVVLPPLGPLARDECEYNPADYWMSWSGRRQRDPRQTFHDQLHTFLTSMFPGPLRMYHPCGLLPAGMVVCQSQRQHRQWAAALDRRSPCVQAVRGTYHPVAARRRAAIRQALASRDPLAAAWGVWVLERDALAELRPALRAAVASGVLHRYPQPDQGVVSIGVTAWEMLSLDQQENEAALVETLEQLCQSAGRNLHVEVTLADALRSRLRLVRHAAAKALAHQEGSQVIYELVAAHTQGDPELAQYRDAALTAHAAGWLKELEQALRSQNHAASVRWLELLLRLESFRPAVMDSLASLFRGAKTWPPGTDETNYLYLDLLRDSDPEVRRIACLRIAWSEKASSLSSRPAAPSRCCWATRWWAKRQPRLCSGSVEGVHDPLRGDLPTLDA